MPRQTPNQLMARFLRFWKYLTPGTIKDVIAQAARLRFPGLSAEIAYNAMLAIFPATLMLLTAIGLVDLSEETVTALLRQLDRVAPVEVVALIQGFINEIHRSGSQSLLSLSFLGSLWAASGAVSAIMNALDQIYQVPPDQVRPFWQNKLVSLALTIGTIQLMVLAVVLIFLSDFAIQLLATHSGVMQLWVLGIWHSLNLPVALGIVVMSSAFIYRYGPSRWQTGTPLLPGAILAAVFWALFSILFRLYVVHFGHYNRAYGAIGAFIVLLLWLQLSSLMLLIGAQLNMTVSLAMRRSRPSRLEGN